jgi:hypothetical protein
MKHIEDSIQEAAFKVIRLLGKQNQFYRTIHAIPNGGKRDVATAARLKRQGVLAGVLDIFVPAASLYIEVKAPKGKLSLAQAQFGLDVQGEYYIAICRSSADILEVLHISEMASQGSYQHIQSLTNYTNDALNECKKIIDKESAK